MVVKTVENLFINQAASQTFPFFFFGNNEIIATPTRSIFLSNKLLPQMIGYLSSIATKRFFRSK